MGRPGRQEVARGPQHAPGPFKGQVAFGTPSQLRCLVPVGPARLHRADVNSPSVADGQQRPSGRFKLSHSPR